MIKEFHVATLDEFYQALGIIERADRQISGSDTIKRYWFRGQSYNHYNLLPSLYRGKFYEQNTEQTYSQMNLKEDYRYQHLKTRVFHSVHSNPQYQSEWQEIYQHHFGHTRLMDWSESARIALLFALEAFIDTRFDRELEYKRQHVTPCIWMLDPYKLNRKVYEYFSNYFMGDMRDYFSRYYSGRIDLDKLCKELKVHPELYFDTEDGDLEIRGVISLCTIEDYRKTLGIDMDAAVRRYEMNPFYYLALKMYSDALPYSIKDWKKPFLPPMAVLHPYHSERIRIQRGAFTMFPNYIVSEKAKNFYQNRKIDIRAMDQQAYIEDCLKVIYILNPDKMARELMQSGARRSDLYPDIQVYADIIETKEYYY